MKRLINCFLSALLLSVTVLPVQAANNTYVYDEASVLSSTELSDLNSVAREISETYECGIYVVYTTDLHGYSEDDYARNIYVEYDLGYGEAAEGVLLAIAVDDRYYDTESYGNAGLVFDYDTLEEFSNNGITPYLSEDAWADAGYSFIYDCETALSDSDYSYPERNADGTYNQPVYNDSTLEYTGGVGVTGAKSFTDKLRYFWSDVLPYAAIIGFLVALIYALINAKKLKNTGVAYSANEYIPKGGMKITGSRDRYLRTEHHRIRIHHDDDRGGGGGGGHSYSGGGFSGGGGGHHF